MLRTWQPFWHSMRACCGLSKGPPDQERTEGETAVMNCSRFGQGCGRQTIFPGLQAGDFAEQRVDDPGRWVRCAPGEGLDRGQQLFLGGVLKDTHGSRRYRREESVEIH